MSAKKIDPIWSHCNKCGVRTRHDILCEAVEQGDEHYSFWAQHAVIECRGCATKSFRYHFKDIENAFPIDHDEWDVPEEIECYPKEEDKVTSVNVV